MNETTRTEKQAQCVCGTTEYPYVVANYAVIASRKEIIDNNLDPNATWYQVWDQCQACRRWLKPVPRHFARA